MTTALSDPLDSARGASEPFALSDSSSSSSSWISPSKSDSGCAPASHEHLPNVATADPVHISQLWDTVMSDGAQTESSKGGGKKEAPSATGTLKSASASTSSLSQHPLLATPTSSSQTPKKERTAKFSDPDFETTVLTPYGITIEGQTETRRLYDHFSYPFLTYDCAERFGYFHVGVLEILGKQQDSIAYYIHGVRGTLVNSTTDRVS
ncbi:hypothetical protein F4859DRAFT_512435 [Xylaria cf. heliscus]|nr:hypothetical protein F4859DRAFT_512435 [Xylaria cf. heliscus]